MASGVPTTAGRRLIIRRPGTSTNRANRGREPSAVLRRIPSSRADSHPRHHLGHHLRGHPVAGRRRRLVDAGSSGGPGYRPDGGIRPEPPGAVQPGQAHVAAILLLGVQLPAGRHGVFLCLRAARERPGVGTAGLYAVDHCFGAALHLDRGPAHRHLFRGPPILHRRLRDDHHRTGGAGDAAVPAGADLHASRIRMVRGEHGRVVLARVRRCGVELGSRGRHAGAPVAADGDRRTGLRRVAPCASCARTCSTN